jgi:hypothetical protein
LIPFWNWKTTGDWRTTPYALYAKRYFPYERPGFGLDPTPPERRLPAGLTPFDAEFRSIHRRFTAATLPSALLRRSADAAGQVWGGRLFLALFFALGLAALSAESALALACAFGILVVYLVYALSPGAAPYYAEGYPAFALVTALGLRAAMSWLGTRAVPRIAAFLLPAFVLALLAPAGLQAVVTRARKQLDSNAYAQFRAQVDALGGRGAVVFVPCTAVRPASCEWVRNVPDLSREAVWVARDLGEHDAALIAVAGGRRQFRVGDDGRLRPILGLAPPL